MEDIAALDTLPLPIPPPAVDADGATEERHVAKSPCGSVRVCRPLTGGGLQENIENMENMENTENTEVVDHLGVIEQLKKCAIEATPSGTWATAAVSTTTTSVAEASRQPLKLVSSSPGEPNVGTEHPFARNITQTADDMLFRCRPDDPYTGRPILGTRAHSSRDATLDDCNVKMPDMPVGEALIESIKSSKAFLSGPQPAQAQTRRPFRKWVQTFNRRRAERHRCNQQEELDLDTDAVAVLLTPRTIGDSSYRRHSSSVSSFAYVAGIRDASISGFATASIGPSSRKQARSSKVLSRTTDRSSRFSMSARQSDDDTANDRQKQLAEAHIVARSIHRRRILEELIETEEGYIGDIKFLMNAYMTIFASSPSADAGLRLSMYSNLTDIVELHDQILGELHRVIPDSEYSHLSMPRPPFGAQSLPARMSVTANIASEGQGKGKRQSALRKEVTEMTIAPEIAAQAANVFVRRIDRFYIYEEYRAKLDMVLDDLKATYRSIPNWGDHQRGLEALASCLSYSRDWQDSKRALSIDDLLAKPIQRACRYPLLLQELLKSTPVCDCPRSHSDIETALEKLHQVTIAMNKATEDPFFKSHLEKTWLLQERLVFPPDARNGATKSQIRQFGRIDLCGVLHVCWQTQASVRGSYMICLLYHNWLCLAIVNKTGKLYELQACIPLIKCSLEQADNGRGLQCHSAPFTWKVMFESRGQLYEILMTASTKSEEEVWRHRIHDGGRREDNHEYQSDRPMFTFLRLDVKTLGAALKSPDSSVRKHSIRRATTVPPKVQLFQVILKNTSSENGESQSLSRQLSLGRSHSVLKASRVPVIAPSRGDRARLESSISDVCTRDVLMSSTLSPRSRTERIRPSASAMMRKINVPSLSGTFGRRTTARPPAVIADMTSEAVFTSHPIPKASPSPRQQSGEHRMRLSIGHARLRHHNRDAKAGASPLFHEETEKDKKSEKTGKLFKGRLSSSSGDDAKVYSLTGNAEKRPTEPQRPKYSLFQRESSEREAEVPRCPPAQLLGGLDESYGTVSAIPQTVLPSLPSIPLMASATSSSFLRAVMARPRSSGQESKSSTSATGELLTLRSTFRMERREDRDREEQEQQKEGERVEELETKPSRRWLKRPSMHRPSLHRTKKIH